MDFIQSLGDNVGGFFMLLVIIAVVGVSLFGWGNYFTDGSNIAFVPGCFSKILIWGIVITVIYLVAGSQLFGWAVFAMIIYGVYKII
ncbi:hypothetical protein [Limosilactobacillus fastidiosus]|uniref:Uncharacterized protein n=1 Tax=Limosilactobacillus fastidiosus TaxID=2759855 RepID=A0A7W3TZA9_9LACO|nr:hypothetical protein [Limosilactobacillus fastidiosus]MBB1063292.1 hypothetical protein [Limosilactobacillus fastidiosus]MBB1086068.1 hypothetical protein [Limosilactobacillus fastidiosus]MCD7084602.1 hypothetical protein [Limosilactobacillus fastidiosus]MCD7086287.1 hypothetical protein [Limosilactobacillus fastidiosus]MCD7114494.1 hypothetical protein [Limosilactobacillus fastidiosus]